MDLQRKPPAWVLHHGFDAGFHIDLAFRLVFTKTRLQKTMFGFNILILRQILTEIDHLQLITML